jgi:hypothetical protein
MLVDKSEQSEVYFKGIFSNKILIFAAVSEENIVFLYLANDKLPLVVMSCDKSEYNEVLLIFNLITSAKFDFNLPSCG